MKRDQIASLHSSLRMMGIAVGAISASDERALALDHEQLPMFKVKPPVTAPGRNRVVSVTC